MVAEQSHVNNESVSMINFKKVRVGDTLCGVHDLMDNRNVKISDFSEGKAFFQDGLLLGGLSSGRTFSPVVGGWALFRAPIS